ncbi:hypothetical protein INR49_014351, partial [Caranx melampygus]
MWDARKLLVATVVFTAVFYRLAAQETKPLNTAPDAVDYLYDKCSEEAKRRLDSDLLEKELNQSGVEFNTAWKTGFDCSKQVPGGEKKQITALSAYFNAGEPFQNTFNNEVETKGVDVNTYNSFNFKSLHYLLMSSMEMHQKINCTTVYAFIEGQFHATNGSEVRLGRFVMAEKSFAEIRRSLPEDSFIFNITSCFFVNLRGKTCNSKSENALLLSPAEMFTVEGQNTIRDEDNGDYTMIVLKHSSLKKRYNCQLASKSPGLNVSSQWLVLVLAAIPVDGYRGHGVDAGEHSGDREEVVKPAVDFSEVPLSVRRVDEVDECVERGHRHVRESQVQQEIVGHGPHPFVRQNDPYHDQVAKDGHSQHGAVSHGPERDAPRRLHELV